MRDHKKPSKTERDVIPCVLRVAIREAKDLPISEPIEKHP